MAGDDGSRLCHAAAVLLVLCALTDSLTCFSLSGLSKTVKQDEVASVASGMEVKRGSSLFNGKELNSQSAATGNDGLLHIDSDQSDGTGMLEQPSQLGDNMADEAAWRRLNCSLHCGQSKMKLRAMGPGAADLQLDMGNARPLPLTQVPGSCDYSMRQNALGLVLVVPYDGCNVIQEDGNYVLPMSWLGTLVKFTCPMLRSSAPAPPSTTPKPTQQPWTPLYVSDPSSDYYSYLYYCYYMNMMMMMMTPAPTPGAATTTAKPDVTTVTPKPSVEKPPPANPYYYPYYPYYPYPQYPYYTLPNIPVKTAKPTTTAKPITTGPVTSGMTTTAKMTTAEPAVTTKTPQKTPKPYYPSYYPFYPPAGQQMPGDPIYYYQFMQHFYGWPQYPQNPSNPMQTTPPPTLTTVKPVDAVPTIKPTSKPTTVSAPTTTTPCTHTPKPSSGSNPDPVSPYVPYYQLPFAPYLSYNKAGKLPVDQKYMPQAGYKSGLEPRAHPHQGFNYWQPVPWFPLNGQRRSSI
ncbi:uncharacterized protein LOC141777189 [Sebastes fasciatus]|uniref:uncharacterized protein LOC141777189 n=1 Tax=Sebastes fasciatus TaxID=394691 RepID=UPI003D9DB99B